MGNRKHTVEVIQPELEIDEDLALHEKGWKVQRVGWIVIMAVVLAGLLGLFGDGWLSKKKVVAQGINTQYQRFYRYETEMKVLVESSEHISSISLDQSYVKEFKIMRFVPEPENNSTNSNVVTFHFLPANNRIVSLYLLPKNFGTVKGAMKINDRTTINLNHFIYP